MLDRAALQLGWPNPENIFSPKNEGSRILALNAQDKLRRGIDRQHRTGEVKVGLLLPEEAGESTPAPIAIVCEFSRVPSSEVLETAHRLAWNYSKAPLLLTVDPSCVRAWTCCEVPIGEPDLFSLEGPEIADVRVDWGAEQTQIATALHWVNLVSGRFFSDRSQRFQPAGRLDQVLLGNLKAIREQLHTAGLPYSLAHDLLGRVIFIQFLFQRTDSRGYAALNAAFLSRLTEQGVLKDKHDNLVDILSNKADTYRFFRWLNEKFNGDLFPGKGAEEREREQEWQDEIRQVSTDHLQLLAEFVSGRLLPGSGQRSLFPLYSFDTIPLELISSIYEEFVSAEHETNTGVHYTPSHLVDLVLDGVLPWEDSQWDLKVLDASCGSGIFLVKAFQRLIYRWRRAHASEEPTAADLKQILENSIFGIDINAEAVRVASFSLYLAMCDGIDPRYYWNQVRFPRLRGRNFHAGDYFALQRDRPDLDRLRFDVIIGNAPWGKDTATVDAETWAAENHWPCSYGTLGPLFLPRATQSLSMSGTISMLEPASVLTNSVGTAQAFRARLFSEFKIEEVINLSALRFGLFANAVDPACVITLRKTPPDAEFISYVCPKPTRSSLDDYRISIDAQDINLIAPADAAHGTDVWSVLMWGGPRDLALVRRLRTLPNLAKLERENVVRTREGIIRGDKKKRLNKILGRRILEGKNAPTLQQELSPRDLSVNRDARVDSRASTDFDAFTIPQLIVKQGWRKAAGRFEAAIVKGRPGSPGVLCSQSYISVSSQDSKVLKTACAVYNSIVAVYFLLLTSGRFASYRPESTAGDLLQVPIPIPTGRSRNSRLEVEDLDEYVRGLFELHDLEWKLIRDAFVFTLPDFKGDANSAGRVRTKRGNSDRDELVRYCESVTKVLRSAFGADKEMHCVVYEELGGNLLPIRVATIHLRDTGSPSSIERRNLTSDLLLAELYDLGHQMVLPPHEDAPIIRSRTMRMYTTLMTAGKPDPCVVIVKPDQRRYWTSSAGARDADEIAADFMTWRTAPRTEVASRVH